MLEFVNRYLDKLAVSRCKKSGLTEYARLWLQGEDVNIQGMAGASALKVNVVYSAVKVLAETLASMNLLLFERLPNDDKERAVNNPLYWMLKQQPNHWQTSYEFIELLMTHLALRGNAYSWIKKGADGKIKELIPLNPVSVTLQKTGDFTFFYRWTPMAGGQQTFLPSEIFHIKNLSTDGFLGLSPISLAALSIDTAKRGEIFENSIFKTGGSRRMALKYPGTMKPEAEERLRNSWNKTYAGGNSVAVLEDGLDAIEIGISPKDLQFIASREFSISEIARIFRVPPHMIGDLKRATFSNITDQTLSFLKYTMAPWIKRFEQAITRDLIKEEKRFFAEFLVDTLLRGDIKTRYEIYRMGIQDGHLSRQEARKMESRNNGPDELNEFLVLANMTLASQLGEEPEPEPEPEPTEEEQAAEDEERMYGPQIEDIAERLSSAEATAISKKIKHGFDNGEYEAWIKSYNSKHAGYILKTVKPLLQAAGKDDIQTRLFLKQNMELTALKEWAKTDEPKGFAKEWRTLRRKYIKYLLISRISGNFYRRIESGTEAVAVLSDISRIAEPSGRQEDIN